MTTHLLGLIQSRLGAGRLARLVRDIASMVVFEKKCGGTASDESMPPSMVVLSTNEPVWKAHERVAADAHLAGDGGVGTGRVLDAVDALGPVAAQRAAHAGRDREADRREDGQQDAHRRAKARVVDRARDASRDCVTVIVCQGNVLYDPPGKVRCGGGASARRGAVWG